LFSQETGDKIRKLRGVGWVIVAFRRLAFLEKFFVFSGDRG
jgi:hypothetical protein